MLLEFFNILNNITPLISTTAKSTLIFNNNNSRGYFINTLLITKFIFLLISFGYLSYLYFYLKQKYNVQHIPNILIPKIFIILLLTITFIYTFFNFYIINPPKKK